MDYREYEGLDARLQEYCDLQVFGYDLPVLVPSTCRAAGDDTLFCSRLLIGAASRFALKRSRHLAVLKPGVSRIGGLPQHTKGYPYAGAAFCSQLNNRSVLLLARHEHSLQRGRQILRQGGAENEHS
jgi:hypothetical protein